MVNNIVTRAEVEALQILVKAGVISMDVPWADAVTKAGDIILSLSNAIATGRAANSKEKEEWPSKDMPGTDLQG